MSDTQTPASPKIKPAKPEAAPERTRLEKLLEQRQALDNRIKAQQNREATQKRHQETRAKILIGAAIQKQISAGKLTEAWLKAILEAELTLKRDREVFKLPPLPEATATTKT
ncbi:hypothetical protein [Stenomitos frigidus]|uniref:Mobilization protein n=1 Tax=Stenomitos frigidus ULC18 TaxID=2107698 RepID=A0A2T1E846_9CYAN|nr:hypothetical protein [Stenomitos frigidus]PSB28864.1 hypothetical protein C7B82_12495 [Stenomitos frigidus ULC18]